MPKRNQGYLEIDHRYSPGLPIAKLTSMGLPIEAQRAHFEAETYTCGHCTGVVVMNPDRVRERATCRSCDSWLCDHCGAVRKASGECRSFNAFQEQAQELADNPRGLDDLLRKRNG